MRVRLQVPDNGRHALKPEIVPCGPTATPGRAPGRRPLSLTEERRSPW
jgi:hypothetical protein